MGGVPIPVEAPLTTTPSGAWWLVGLVIAVAVALLVLVGTLLYARRAERRAEVAEPPEARRAA